MSGKLLSDSFMSVRSFYKSLRNRFLEGPDWIEFPYFTIKGYRPRMLIVVAWLYGFYNRLFSIPGRMILSVSALIIVYSFTLLTTPIIILAFAIIAVFMTDIFLGFIFRPKLKIERVSPEKVRANSKFKIAYYIENLRFLPAVFIRVDPYPFKKDIFYFTPLAVTWISGKEKIYLETGAVIKKRGSYRLYAPIAESLFPFGIFKWSCRGYNANKILVHPDYTPLISLNLPTGMEYQPDKNTMLANKGYSPDFFGCREFMPGDDPRHIHWLSSAKRNELVIKEYQEEYLARTALILDTFIPTKKILNFFFVKRKSFLPQFESAVSLTAAVSDILLSKDYVVDIFAVGPDVFHFKGARSSLCFEKILDILSTLRPVSTKTVLDLQPEILKYISSIGSATVILLNWDEKTKKFIDKLHHSSGLKTKIFFIRPEDKKIRTAELPEYISQLNSEEILTGRIKYL